jgi:cytochrome oxidase Cu insertion factor (SCO1/SenC/PrrC family)
MNRNHPTAEGASSAAPAFWTAAASEARRRFGLSRELQTPKKSAVAAALCQRSPKVRLAPLALALSLFTGGGFPAELPRTADHDYDPPTPGSYALPVVKQAADGEVLDSDGRPLRLRELTRGRVTVMSFIYTRCAAAKACPYATGVLLELHRLSADDPELAGRMRLVSMSFDSAGDTPERMAAYAGLAGDRKSAAEWRFLTTASQEKLKPILDAYGQAVDKKQNPLDPTGPLNHTLRVFLIDRAGNIRNIYSSGTLDVRLVLADVKTLLLEDQSVSRR